MHNGFFSQPAPVTSGQGVFGIPCILRKACGIKKGWMFAIEQAALAQGVIAPIESLHGQRSDIQQASEESDMFRFGGNPLPFFLDPFGFSYSTSHQAFSRADHRTDPGIPI
ncbi:hypothetical protein [Bifidobacterium moukalabense]|jgi:hypothetical protein|uniref:hypothetical protein n=1 Tax=Bifidobacterium moukalabense TaxID=1333651 RepID=UPI0010F6BF18|nr:hypothetical protein [Bifidobacterium moukalabense]